MVISIYVSDNVGVHPRVVPKLGSTKRDSFTHSGFQVLRTSKNFSRRCLSGF